MTGTSSRLFLVLILAVCSFDHLAQAQKLSRSDRDLADTILGNVSTDVRKNYFDANLHGLDWEALVSQTKQAIADAPNMGMANAEIAALLEKLNDSHTRYFPPRSTLTVDYGWQFQMVGNRCFVTQVRPKSDAEAKGMKPGDEILTVEGFTVDRQSLPRLQYAMTILMPRSRLTVEIRDLSGKIQKLTIDASVKKNQVVSGLGDESWGLNEIKIREENAWKKGRAQYKELGPDLMILRIPEFIETDSDVDALIKKARNHKTLIVDLRGTPGGLVDSLRTYLEDIFPHDVKIGDWVRRNKASPMSVKSNARDAFKGDLIVLIDSRTASAGEIFARVVQLEQRGTILGDHSSGRTMESEEFIHETGTNPVFIYGSSITIADTVMSDGKSLEHIGVQPDRLFLPAAADLAANRDPVLAYAAGLAGVKLSPEDAAKLFPHDYPAD